ncbi:adenomatous polyposis coli homolog isoform X2 [Euwallacea similis]|uniref:adenomatous polyposis coli homolog isoform X2 n=1 Tax=Euwallacea similis TaxID=1736056 RepID=UPI00344F0372
MSLPVSQYEALLAEVRGLRRKAQRVQQLARPLIGNSSQSVQNEKPLDYTMESLLLNQQHDRSNSPNYDQGSSISDPDHLSSEDEYRLGTSKDKSSRSTAQMSVSSEPTATIRTEGQAPTESMFHGAWPNVTRVSLWNSEPASLERSSSAAQNQRKELGACSSICQNDVSSVMSFASSSGGVPIDRVLCSPEQKWSSQQLEAKMDVVNRLLSMLGSQDHVDMGETLLALSSCPESCLAMRQSGCIPLLVQLVQSDKESENRKKAAQALHNLVNSQPDEKIRKREVRILKLLEDTRRYIECLKYNLEYEGDTCESLSSTQSEDSDRHPVQTVAHLMKLSFDEGHRQAICQLGGIHTLATLVECEHSLHDTVTQEGHCVLMRRYACMALTNLTFGDSGNKTLLCSYRDFMRALISQLQSPSDELRQVTASVLRNLSWRADSTSKEILREVGSVTGLMKAAMLKNKENTLKSILSALWNLSAHCTENKSEICAVEGGLAFLVNMLTYKTPSKSLAIIENAGGILRNISSQIAVRDDYRGTLRDHNCLHVLLDQLKSPSLTIVSNACGTLWNLSAKNAQDQETLWQMGAPAMLRSLNHSKHKMIAMGSSAALKNLLSCKPQQSLVHKMDSTALALNLPELPTLGARKQKALMEDLNTTLSETYENIDKDSPVKFTTETSVDITTFVHGTRPKMGNSSPEQLTNAFASLNLNEPSTSYALDARHKSKIPQNYGGSSLPYVPQLTRRSNPASFLPIKAKFSNHAYNDDTPEQPIDYSRKYSESSGTKPRNIPLEMSKSDERKYSDKKETDDFDIGYTETDLDQPTDYSLRYAEDDSDSEICSKITKQEFVQDTVKTYCTEGTPYETPFVFSNATSMSDLRNVGTIDVKTEINNEITTNVDSKDNKEIKDIEEKDRCSTEDISEIENAAMKPQKSEFSSGMMSPEKPVNYCEEGTPGYFSRVSSFGSGLDSLPTNETVIKKDVKLEENPNEVSSSAQKMIRDEKVASTPKTPNEAKVVKFEQVRMREVVNYAEQTPLMFSRSSSLASLDSVEQHSIHDDRSSIVSDFSRLTSGIVSPSELPDSPTQTVPSSPRALKQKLDFPGPSKHARQNLEHKQKPPQKSSVFEDNITKFKEESTPIQFSTTTSLSSLTIDDNEDHDSRDKTPDAKLTHQTPKVSIELTTTDEQQQEKKDNEKDTSGFDELNDDSDGDDDDILAACISDGMQSNISVPTATSTPNKLPGTAYQYQHQSMKIQSNSTGIPMMRRTTPPRHESVVNTVLLSEDPPKMYCTEDTPAELSRAGSHSNLSVLSIPKSKAGDFSSDESSNLSAENENILEECIQSAMPKSKKDLNDTNLQSKLPATSILPRRVSPPFKHSQHVHSQIASDQHVTVVRKSEESVKVASAFNYKHHPGLERINNPKQKGYDGREVKSKDRDRRETSLPPYFSIKDEVANYEVEDSPCQYSLRSSLSDLTVDGSVAGLKPFPKSPNPAAKSSSAGPSKKLSVSDNRAISNESQRLQNKQPRRESLSSLSSLASNEGDQVLLEECIYAGMPTDKQEEALLNECIQAGMHSVNRSSAPNNMKSFEGDGFLNQNQHISEGENRSKNVNVASVAGSTVVIQPQVSEQCPKISTTVAGVEEGPAPNRSDKNDTDNLDSSGQPSRVQDAQRARTGTPPAADTLPVKFSHSEENLLTDQTKSGSSKSVSQFLEGSFENDFTFSNSDNCANLDHEFTRSCEESGNLVDNRMLDPDAMIESLDRFTAELVSQASHLNKDKVSSQLDLPNLSNVDDNTWNDDTSQNEVTFPTMSGSAPNVITFGSEQNDGCSGEDVIDAGDNRDEGISNDFSSINTSTMTESTLIAIEAARIATVFKKEAEMSQSISIAKSLDLDSVKPPSELNSLTNSTIGGHDRGTPRSPKLVSRKKSLPGSLLVKRALSNSLNHGSSRKSLNNNSIENIDGLDPPSEMQNLVDMDNSITSIASLPHEETELQPEFIINGSMEKVAQDCWPHPIFNVKQQFSAFGQNSSVTDLEMVNPPSIFNDITDMCNSLADVATDVIGTETSVFEDCLTHMAEHTFVDNSLPVDTSEFSDANSVTPIQTDNSSVENTPKKSSKTANKIVMTKQRRNLARDRYKTYVVAAEKVMRESMEREFLLRDCTKDNSDASTEDYKTVNDKTEPLESTVDATYTVSTTKLTPKERRRLNRFRFETQVLDEATIPQHNRSVENRKSRSPSGSPSPTRSKLAIRRNFQQKRLENKERFKTRTLSETSFGSPEILSASPSCEGSDIHSLVEKEANLVLKTIRDSKLLHDEMLDSETLSLVSNDEDSEQTFSVNYRTYHKSWSLKKPNVPAIVSQSNGSSLQQNGNPCKQIKNTVEVEEFSSLEPRKIRSLQSVNSDEENCPEQTIVKPKIVKPTVTTVSEVSDEPENEEQPKGIRGRRKPLYSKTNLGSKVAPKTIKPAKTMAASNLVKNVTSTIKSGSALKNVVITQHHKPTATSKPPVPNQVKSSGYGLVRNGANSGNKGTTNSRSSSGNNSPKSSPNHTEKGTSPLERQGTFTKDASSAPTTNSTKQPSRAPVPPSKIPSFARQIARAVTSKIPANINPPNSIGRSTTTTKALSADRTNKTSRIYNRSTSADSRETAKKIQPSSSTQSLKGESRTPPNGVLRRTGIPSPAPRSNSNVSVASNGSAKKQVTSKIASLWKKVEENRGKQQPVQDKRVWMTPSTVQQNEVKEESNLMVSPVNQS